VPADVVCVPLIWAHMANVNDAPARGLGGDVVNLLLTRAETEAIASLAARLPRRDQGRGGVPPPGRLGPSPHLKKRLWDGLPAEERTCPICMDAIRAFDDFSLRLCGHVFHASCDARTNVCAICRAE
jgi:hypothetical protein